MDPDDDAVPGDPDLLPIGGRAGRRPSRSVAASVRPDVLAVVALGGMLGATARYAIARAVPTHAGQFPWATFWTNLSGSLVLGALVVVLVARAPSGRYVRPFLATGVIGAYTTMSTYLVETALLIKDGHAVTGLLYGVGSLAAGIGLAAVGVTVARGLVHRGGAGAGR